MKTVIYAAALCCFTSLAIPTQAQVVDCLKVLLERKGGNHDRKIAIAARSEDYVNRLARNRALASMGRGEFTPEQLLLNPALLTVQFPLEARISIDDTDPFYSDIQRAIDITSARQIADEIETPYSGSEFAQQLEELNDFEGRAISPGIVLSFQTPREMQPHAIEYLSTETFADMARLLVIEPSIPQALPTPDFVNVATRIQSPLVTWRLNSSFSEVYCIGVVYSDEGHSTGHWQFSDVFGTLLYQALENSLGSDVRIHFPQALSLRYTANWTKETVSLKQDLDLREKPAKEALLRRLLNDLSEASGEDHFEKLSPDHPVEWNEAGGATISTMNTEGDLEIRFVFE